MNMQLHGVSYVCRSSPDTLDNLTVDAGYDDKYSAYQYTGLAGGRQEDGWVFHCWVLLTLQVGLQSHIILCSNLIT
jgi:hypothetical protein